MALTGTREWRDTDDPYMDAVCDTILDYHDNEVKAFIDSEYHNDVIKQCMKRIADLYTSALLTPARNKCSANEKFFERIDLETQILYDFGMEYIGFEKVRH